VSTRFAMMLASCMLRDLEAVARPPSEFRDGKEAVHRRLVETLGLNGLRGPYGLQLDPPAAEAWDLAAKLVVAVVPSIVDTLGDKRVTVPNRNGYAARPPAIIDEELWRAALLLGLPLTSMFALECFDAAWLAVARSQRSDAPDARLPSILRVEGALWGLAGVPPPYAVRFALTEWFRPRPRTTPARSAGICLRCGRVERRWRWSGEAEPRCENCRKRSKADAAPPTGAIAYGGRGTWWLRCQTAGCANAFEGRRQARHCPTHDRSAMTASRRAELWTDDG